MKGKLFLLPHTNTTCFVTTMTPVRSAESLPGQTECCGDVNPCPNIKVTTSLCSDLIYIMSRMLNLLACEMLEYLFCENTKKYIKPTLLIIGMVQPLLSKHAGRVS